MAKKKTTKDAAAATPATDANVTATVPMELKTRIVNDTFHTSAGASQITLAQAQALGAGVDIHPSAAGVTDPNAPVWVRATQSLTDEVSAAVQSQASATSATENPAMSTGAVVNDQTASANAVEPESTQQFVVETGIPMSKSIRTFGGPRESKYPFAQLPAPQANDAGEMSYASFHIADTEQFPNAYKKYAGVVSSASSKAKKTHSGDGVPAKFVIRRVDKSDPRGAGARVYRVQ